jgi:hypothetical protein
MFGCKDMVHVGLQEHDTCWDARAWHMLGCKVVSYIQGNRAHVFNITQGTITEREREKARNLHQDQRINDY